MPNGGVDEQIKFSSGHIAVMFISTKGLFKDEEKKVLNAILSSMDKNIDSVIFYGFCFGRYDLVVEFKENSAKVASNIVCDLQDKIVKTIQEEKREIKDPICSSLTLCNKISSNKIGSKDIINGCPIRTYTFLKPKIEGVKLEYVIKKLKPSMELFWTSSSYTFLLCTNGYNFSKVFSEILEFREDTRQYFSESCTYVGLAWAGEEEPVEEGIKVLTFVKLKACYGGLKLKPDEKVIWTMDKRLGWSDISLGTQKPTLREIKEKILELRKNHDEIANTSTLILPRERE